MRVIARAKVNLFLAVKGLRADGFHEVETVMQSIDLRDELTFERSSELEVEIDWRTGLTGPTPQKPDLVERALLLTGTRMHVKVVKGIPVEAGLGGGSADAAAALLAAQHLGHGDIDLAEAARSLGSDVLFALGGGTSIARGRGDQLEAVSSGAVIWWVVAVPGFGMSTASVYARSGKSSAVHTATDVADALGAGGPLELAALLHNDLELPAFELRPELRELKVSVQKSGALAAVMTGSGSAVAGLCADEHQARSSAAALEGKARWVFAVPSTNAGAEIVE